MKIRALMSFVCFLLAIPAHASFSYYLGTSGSTAFSSALSTTGLTLSSTPAFTATSLVNGGIEYDDATTGMKFFGFNAANSATDPFAISGGALQESGSLIEIVLPGNVYAFSATLSFSGASFANLCIEAGVSSFSSTCSLAQNPLWSSGTEFVGVISDAPFNTIWIGPAQGNSPILNIISASDATAPEAGTLLMLGGGLIGVGTLRRWRKRPSAEPSGR